MISAHIRSHLFDNPIIIIWCARSILAHEMTLAPYILHFDLINRSQIIRRVVGHSNCNDTMLRRSEQLILTSQNEHFEGSMHPKAGQTTAYRNNTGASGSGRRITGPQNRILGFPLSDACYLQSARSLASVICMSWTDHRNIVSLQLPCPTTLLMIWERLRSQNTKCMVLYNFVVSKSLSFRIRIHHYIVF